MRVQKARGTWRASVKALEAVIRAEISFPKDGKPQRDFNGSDVICWRTSENHVGAVRSDCRPPSG